MRNAPKRLSVGAMYAISNAASAHEAAFDATYLVQTGDEPNGTANILRDAPLTDSDQDAAGILDPRPSVSGFGGRVYARRPASGFARLPQCASVGPGDGTAYGNPPVWWVSAALTTMGSPVASQVVR